MKKNTKLSIDLSGAVVVVIGGTGSIGEEISFGFAEAKAQVIVCGRNSSTLSSHLQDKSKNSKNISKNISFIPLDVCNEDSIKHLVNSIISKYRTLDILVLAQGIQIRKPFYQYDREEWHKILDTNLTGTFLVTKYLTPLMIEQKKGKIIGITSLTTEFGIRNASAYAASKGGMAQYLKTLALELAEYNITVNMVAPGRIKTRMTKDILEKKNIKESNLRCIPLGRFGLPSDVVGAVLFLSSESAGYITGQTIFVDGGWLAAMGNVKS